MAELDVEPASFILLDLFPCTVVSPQGDVVDDSRVIVTDNHFYAIVDAPRGPELAVKEPLLEEYSGSLLDGYQVNGHQITKKSSCACGSRLRSLFPFLGVPFAPVK